MLLSTRGKFVTLPLRSINREAQMEMYYLVRLLQFQN